MTKQVYAKIIVIVYNIHKNYKKTYKSMLKRLQKYYTFRQKYKPGNKIMHIWSDNTIGFDNKWFSAMCMGCSDTTPLSFKTFRKYFNQLVIKKDKKLLNKLYKWEYQKLEKEHANDPYWISPGIYTAKNLKKAILERRRAFGVK